MEGNGTCPVPELYLSERTSVYRHLLFQAPADSFVAHFVVGSLLPTHVPVSPFVHPPVAAAYEPFAAEPSFVTLPVNITFWPFSLSVILMEFPLRVPDIAAESAQGSPAKLNEPEICEPFCAIIPVAVI